MATVDTIRLVFTYLVVFITIIGGGYALVFVPLEQETKLAIVGFIGAALQFAFGQEIQTRTARQTSAAATAGGVIHANGLTGTAPPSAEQ